MRPDVTCWAVMALRACGEKNQTVQKARQRLAEWQSADGRIAMSKNQPEVLWPTPLAVLAWSGEAQFDEARRRGVAFLLSVGGVRMPNSPFIKHNVMLKGWPWNEHTHSWIIPTAMSVLALKACGFAGHGRVSEAVELLMDRQLPSGGWNYGNTILFERELMPTEECTGYALNALSGYVEYREVRKSIEYLKKQLPSLKSPLSLSWAVLGLSAWSLQPEDCGQLLLQCLANQSRYGQYSTDLHSQVLISYHAAKGLLSIFENAEPK